ncbi:MAG TPA: ABC transporter substrate-binding protein [Clostridiales bacterium]|nr:ABC transporter substrate-binding protein [Clostridiales bacterium]
MKEKIYTIPVNDAFAATGACPLCTLAATMTENLLQYYLGPALMEPDVRKTTNEKGFCREHLAALYNREENRLGLGLLLHTHTSDLVSDLNPALSRSAPAGGARLFSGRKKDFRQSLLAAADKIEERARSCVICERLDYTMDRYLDVIFFQYFTEPSFKKQFDECQGYCLPHLALLLRGAAKYLNQNQAAEFVSQLALIQNRSLQALCDDIEWFTQKFDYRNQNKDWKNSRDALPRAINKIRGDCGLK